ncbi:MULTISPECIES: hypothetical protein [Thermoactinomyces]|uniref:Uncharacterized protein n=1 Tax=Thermoactinomyces daqus TaxID=1329516 RepID=A0A7W1XCM8_9BACL|nr:MULTISPECIES: hypothetical protein [Thermoactinomyces]MBA4544236.1 hypothetical protein [Thermoactinomyces daqus]MBH8597036.1 hypothetical protein [Thermoactinomyces sp. CICC 10523]MBH8608869.1 hypothetical protein [Thermoactinomyces sp. CICC 10521]
MVLRIKVGGFSVERCAQNAAMANGSNAITQRSLQKQNLSTLLTGSGRLRTAREMVGVVDPDFEDISGWSGDNYQMKDPS